MTDEDRVWKQFIDTCRQGGLLRINKRFDTELVLQVNVFGVWVSLLMWTLAQENLGPTQDSS